MVNIVEIPDGSTNWGPLMRANFAAINLGLATSDAKASAALNIAAKAAGVRTVNGISADDQGNIALPIIDQTARDAAATKYLKPTAGIPKTDLASAVQTSLGKADSAVQPSAIADIATGRLAPTATDVGASTDLNTIFLNGWYLGGPNNPNSPYGGRWVMDVRTAGVGYTYQRFVSLVSDAAGAGNVWERFTNSGTAGGSWSAWKRVVDSTGAIDTYARQVVNGIDLDVRRTSTFAVTPNAFITLPLNVINTDTNGGYNPATYQYTVPADGIYQITGSVRFSDGSLPAGANVGVSIENDVADTPAMFWYTAGSFRNTFNYSRTATLKAGDKMRMFVYVETGGSPAIINATMGLALAATGTTPAPAVDTTARTNAQQALDLAAPLKDNQRLGAFSQPISNADLNSITANGWYNGSNLINAPAGSAEWFFVQVQSYLDTNYRTQTATGFTNPGTGPSIVNRQWRRTNFNGTWSNWVEVRGNAVATVNGNAPDANGNVVVTTSGGGYVKPANGIPKTDLESAVQTSLGKADTALQSAPVTSVNTKTGAVSLTASDVGAAAASHTHTASQISDSTAAGRALLTAADGTAARGTLAAAWSGTTVTGTGSLTGGGDLTTNRTLDLTTAAKTSLGKADTSVQTVNSKTPTNGGVTLTFGDVGAAASTTTVTGTGSLTGGGDLSANRTLDLTATAKTSLGKADTAIQPGDTRVTTGAWTSWVPTGFTGPCEYRLVPNGVQWRGQLIRTAGNYPTNTSTTIGTLPAEAFPPTFYRHSVWMYGTVFAGLQINTTGTVSLQTGGTAGADIYVADWAWAR